MRELRVVRSQRAAFSLCPSRPEGAPTTLGRRIKEEGEPSLSRRAPWESSPRFPWGIAVKSAPIRHSFQAGADPGTSLVSVGHSGEVATGKANTGTKTGTEPDSFWTTFRRLGGQVYAEGIPAVWIRTQLTQGDCQCRNKSQREQGTEFWSESPGVGQQPRASGFLSPWASGARPADS